MNPPLSQISLPRVLVVDDDAALLRLTKRVLVEAGYDVTSAVDGAEAIEIISRMTFDAIVSDISMPGLGGLELLQNVRKSDLDVPVVLVTGEPDLASAARAVALGAHGYLFKPIDYPDLKGVLARAVRIHQLARLKQEALSTLGGGGLGVSDRVGLDASFARAMETLWMAYQPLVRAKDHALFGYEALLRSNEPALPHPGAVIDGAERLGRLAELGQKIRAVAAEPLSSAADSALLFVNLHPRDLLDRDLFSETAPLSQVANRVVLEITERESLDGVPDARGKIGELRAMGFRIAIDDLGAGYAGLASFAALEPEFAKLDMSLIRDVDKSAIKQKLIRSLAVVCRDLGIAVVAEGIETPEERDAVIELGCDLLQGYLLARPGRAFPTVTTW